MAVAFEGGLQIGHSVGGHVARDVAAVFVALVVVVGAVGSLAHDAEGAAFHALDLGQGLEDGFGSRC